MRIGRPDSLSRNLDQLPTLRLMLLLCTRTRVSESSSLTNKGSQLLWRMDCSVDEGMKLRFLHGHRSLADAPSIHQSRPSQNSVGILLLTNNHPLQGHILSHNLNRHLALITMTTTGRHHLRMGMQLQKLSQSHLMIWLSA